MAGNKYTPSSQVRKRISDWEGAAVHSSTIDPLSKKKVSKNNSIDNEASLFASKIPEEIREKVFSNQELADNLFSYSYNVGSHNFKKRVVPTLMNYYSGKASARDVADTMFASGDSKLRGLQKRRDYERSHVVSALQKNSPIYRAQPPVTPIFTPDALRVDTPYSTYVESTTPVPVMVPDENSFVTAHPQTPEERSAMQFNQRMENIQRLNRLFDIADIKNIEIPQYTPRTNPYVISSYSEGGKLKKKSWDDLSMEEKSEMIGVAVRHGYTNISDIRDKYNEFAEGGDTKESHLSYGYPVYWSDEVPSRYNWAKEYLKNHPDVTGFAVGGGAQGPGDEGPREIIRNSHSSYIPDHNDHDSWYTLDKIEAIRHYMDETGYVPNFETSPEQDKFRRDNFSNEDQYGRNDTAWKQSVISRITADKETDKEFGVTPEQFKDYANIMRGLNSKMDNHYGISNEHRGGYYLPEVTITGKKHYMGVPLVESVMNEYSNGGKIYIKPSHRGRLTELKKRTGKTEAELYRTGSPAVRKMITFARSARKWKHGLGGNLFDGTSKPTQQMFVREKNNNPIAFDSEGNLTDQVTGDKGIMNLPEVTISPSRYRSAFKGNSDLAPELLRFTPVLGDALDAADVVKDAYSGDYLNAAIGAGLFALPNFIEKPIKAIGKGAYKLLTAPTRKAAEKGRNTLIEAISSPWNRERWNFAAPTIDTNFIIEDLKQKASTVPFHYSKTRANLGANGETSSHIPPLVYYKDGKKVTDYSNSNLDIYIASDLGKEAYSTGIHEPIHYITNNSHGLLDVKAGNPIFTNLFEPVEIKYTDETLIPRGTLYQHLMTDYNDALLPKINKESRAFKSNDKYNMDKQENQTWLKTWFLTDIKPNLKNPNDASEIETFLNEHPEIIKNNSYVNTLMSDTRPGTNKEYSKALSKMLYSTLGIVGLSNINKND